MKYLWTIAIAMMLSFSNIYATEHAHSEGHKEGQKDNHGEAGHDEAEHNEKHESEHDESKHSDEHSGGHEESSVVGPEKGIIAKGKEGFKLSPEAIKTMALETIAFNGTTISLDRKSIVFSKAEKSVFRLRNGWYKRVSVKLSEKTENSYIASSQELTTGDQIVISGAGFLKIAEVFSEEGAELSHAH